MGKRFLAIIVIATICLCMFVACDEISDEKNVGKATTVSGAKTEKTTQEVTKAQKTVIVEIDPDTVTDKNGIPVTDKNGKTMKNTTKKIEETATTAGKTVKTKIITTTSKEEKTKKHKKTKKGATTEYTFETAENGDIWSPAY